jgi:putative zinc finger/helix-turn-helix YgiT family protein
MAKKQRPPKPFPHLCPECGATAVYPEQTTHRASFKYEGHLHEFEVPNITLNKCRDCGGVILPSTALEQIAEAFRVHAKLLTAAKIRGELRRLKLSQKEFGELLGVAPETVSRWLSSVQIQTHSLDKLMRLFFESADVRKYLADMKAGVSTVETAAHVPSSPQAACAETSDPEPMPQTPLVGFGSCPRSARFSERCSITTQIRQAHFQLIPSIN